MYLLYQGKRAAWLSILIMKRLFIILASAIFVIGVLIALYFVFFAPKGGTLTVGNPFNGIVGGNATPSTDLPTDGTLNNAGVELAPRFIKITDGPVARGSVAFDVNLPSASAAAASATTSSSTPQVSTTPDVEVRFIDRASGNVYSYVAHARTLTRISNKTLPGIQQAAWVSDGSRAYAQFLASTGGEEHVNTYSMNADSGDGYLLENDLAQVQVAGSSTLFTLFSGTTGSVGTISRADGSNSKTLFSSVLSAITVHPTSGDLFATNKPSSQIDGYGFQISRATGSFSRILGPYRGLSVLPNASGSSVIYSYTDGGTFHLRVLNTATRATTALPLATLAEKCVWSADGLSIYCAVPTNMQGDLPDSWYQGVATFSDRIWKIDLSQRIATLVVDPSQVGKVSIDAVNLSIDASEDVIVFSDKHSGALYAYDL